MTNDVFLSPHSIAKTLYPYLISVFPSVFLMIICFPLLLTLSPQLIINFFHDSQLSRSVRMEVLTVSDYSKPGSVFSWTIFHTTQQNMRHIVPGPPLGLSKATTLPVVPAATFVARWCDLQERSARHVAS